MRSSIPLTVAVILTVGAPMAFAADPPADTADSAAVADSGVVWICQYDSATQIATAAKKQILFDVYTDWCRWCRVMAESTLTEPQLAALSSQLVFAKINAEIDTATATRFGVWAYPTLVITNWDGVEVDRIVGYLPPERFRDRVAEILAGKGTLWDLERQLRDQPDDLATVFGLGEIEMRRGRLDAARGYFEQILSRDPKNESGRTDDAAFALAMIARREGNWYKAIEGFRQVLKEHPKSEWREDAALYVPWLYAQAGDTTESLKNYQTFLNDFKKSAEIDWVKARIAALEAATAEEAR